MVTTTDMRQRILEVSERLVQLRGYDGFSYADVAAEVGIRKASIHHHFPTKGDLGLALLERFREHCHARMSGIDSRERSPSDKLLLYVGMFEETLQNEGRMCLCGMLAAGHTTLPTEVRDALVVALQEHQEWLARIIRAGQKAGFFRIDLSARKLSHAWFAGLEGAMLLSRATGDHRSFATTSRALLGWLETAPQQRA